MYRICWISFWIMNLLICCTPMSESSQSSHNNLLNPHPNFLSYIANQNEFKSLQGNPLSLKYSGIQSVKAIYEKRTQKVYFINDMYYKYHYDFCTQYLHDESNVYDFNEENYHANSDRRYVLGNINFFPSKNIYVLDFANSEVFSQDDILLFQAIKSNSFFGKNLYIYPATLEQQEAFIQLHTDVPLITTDELYAQLTYQGLVKKITYGYLRKIDIKDLKKTVLQAHDILYTNGTPLDISTTAGIITTEFQTPLSHLCILSQNRKTPLMAYKNAWDDKYMNSLINEPVKLTVEYDTFYLEKCTKEEVEKYMQPSLKGTLTPALDTITKGLIDCKNISLKNVGYAGGKASHMGELCKIRYKKSPLPLPENPFVIPIYYYRQHVRTHPRLNQYIAALTLHPPQDADSISYLLKQIRKEIKKQDIDQTLLTDVTQKCKAVYHNTNIRFRSSSNVEDLDGFNGAGLYTSKTGILDDTSKTIEQAIKAVWASLWYDGAYQERAYFHVDQSKVGMAILVHPAFGDENINGVAITKNIYRPAENGILFNIQKGELPVVFNSEGVTTEQFLVLMDDWINPDKDPSILPLSYSSLHPAKSMLSKEQQIEAASICNAIKNHYYYEVPKSSKRSMSEFALDIELKWIGPENKLMIKQARVYND